MAPASPDAICPSCSAVGAPRQERARGAQRWTRFSCGACGLEYWSPRGMDRAFYAGPESGTYERRRRGESFLRERHRLFLRRASPGRLLDVGCGEGAFLEVARARGFAVAGLDLDPGNVAAAHARGLTDVACSLLLDEHGALPAQLRGAPPFQWVTAFEVLEHQADPLAFLAAARGLLAPGGALCGSVPNRERALAARDRQRSDGDYPPHHFLWFSPPDLTAMLRRAGFSRVEVAPIREVDAQSYASFLESSLLGGVTSRAKRVARGAGAPPASGGAGGGPTSLRARAIRAARWAKNVPFLPLAVGLRWLAPARARGLYFEARLSG